MTTVSQEAREAYLSMNMLPEFDAADVRAGRWDNTTGLQAFAKFEQSIRQSAERGEAWRPIETAPKDGTRILVYSTTEPPHYDDQQYIKTICEGHHVKEVQSARWISEDDMWELMYIGSPLFWMPLPPAPEAGQ